MEPKCELTTKHSECRVNAFRGRGGPTLSRDGQGNVIHSFLASVGRLSGEGVSQQSLEGRQFTVPTSGCLSPRKPFSLTLEKN